jgi:hypothetical protein
VEAVRQELGDVRSKEINFIGGTTQPDARQAINLSPSLWTGKAAPIFIVPRQVGTLKPGKMSAAFFVHIEPHLSA